MNIEERLTKLEKQNKKLRYFNTISLVLIGMFLVTGFQQQFQLPDIIKAKGFILLDDSGKERAVLKIDTTGNSNSPKLSFFNDKNEILTSVGIYKDLGHLRLYKYFSNNENKDTVTTSLTPEQHGVYLNNNPRYFSFLNNYNNHCIYTHSISLSNEENEVENNLPITNLNWSKYPKLFIYDFDVDGKEEGSFITYKIESINGNFYQRIFDKKDKLRFVQKVYDKNGISNLITSLYDEKENLRLSFGNEILNSSNGNELITPLSTINFFDESGNVIEQLPR